MKPIKTIAGARAGKEYDYVIVGGGAAGCVLASRLSEDVSVSVLLIEAGVGAGVDPRFSMPLAWPSLLNSNKHCWSYEASSAGRKTSPLVGGRILGGSSSINAMSYVRGHRSDYDRWEQAGASGFSYAGVLPYFRKQEKWEGGADAYRGDKGPIAVCRSTLTDPILPAVLQAAQAQGFPINDDYNGVQQEGFGLSQQTIANGRRVSAATAYLEPALRQRRVTLVSAALATRVNIEHGQAVAVQYRQSGRTHVVRASREIIVAAGAVQSPHLLNLSGIGNADDLRKHGITVEADVSGVGGNLHNHVSVSLQYARRQAGTVQRGLRLDRLSRSALEWAISGTGLLASPANAAMGFVRTSQSGGAPDIQMLVLTTSPAARPYLPLGPAYEDGFILGAVLLRPKSTGKVFLRSINPEDMPAVQLNILSSDSDRNVLSEGVRLIDEIGRQAPLASFIAAGRGARPNISGRSQSDAFVMANATPMYHPSGTCRMGTLRDPLAVVDPEFRVRGIGGLRVVDASVMPDIVGGNPVACVTMLAEKASDLIRGRPTAS